MCAQDDWVDGSVKTSESRSRLVKNPFFHRIRRPDFGRDDLLVTLGQWWHPLHYFPTFLANSIAIAPSIRTKAAIGKILYQELGDGRAENAHEILYLSTIASAGLDAAEVEASPPLPATARLIAGYADSAGDWQMALGYVLATETADLFMVGSLGAAITRVTGQSNLPWFDIHVAQEPGHVEEASKALYGAVGPSDQAQVLRHADMMWNLWSDFFSGIDAQLHKTEPALSAVS